MLWARHLLKSCREAITTRHGISIASRSSHMSHHEAWHSLITSYHITSHSHHMVLIMHITSTPHSLSPTMWGVCVTVATHHITSHDITFTSCVFMDGATIYFELSQMPSQTWHGISHHGWMDGMDGWMDGVGGVCVVHLSTCEINLNAGMDLVITLWARQPTQRLSQSHHSMAWHLYRITFISHVPSWELWARQPTQRLSRSHHYKAWHLSSHHITSHHNNATSLKSHHVGVCVWLSLHITSLIITSHHIHIMCLSWMARQIYLRVVAKPSHHGMSISQHIT